MDKDKKFSLDSNFLTENDKLLRADVLFSAERKTKKIPAEELAGVLINGRRVILPSIEEFYEKTKLQKPGYTVTRPTILTVRLGTTKQYQGRDSEVFTDTGYKNGGNITKIEELRDEFHPYWNAITEAGFVPIVHRMQTLPGPVRLMAQGGAWLGLKKPTVEQVAAQWFGHNENRDMVVARATPGLDKDAIRIYEDIGQERVDLLEERGHSDLRMGLNLAVAALKRSMGNMESFTLDVEDTLTQAKNDKFRRDAAVRAIENSIYEIPILSTKQ
ncbi:MAG: hypothetical protein JWN75_390 [Candidatus Saccharibacteria bacterium]|nr:hypothetical protein [Candidatus Saccharibacteria bacterium]